MGIKNLHRILEKYAPICYTTKHLSEFQYKKIAIDISLYLYKYKAISGDRWLDSFVALIHSLRKWNVHCIFIYDGQAPIEKLDEQKRRRETRAKMGDKIAMLENEIQQYEQHQIIGDMMKEICMVPQKSLFHKQLPPRFDLQLAKDRVTKMASQMISITPDDLILSQQLFDVLQIPYTKAPGEAENYAAHLCKYGIVDAVLSEDTDVLAYGAPIFLTKIDTHEDTVVEINYAQILECTGMTSETFTDLCIMCECDYNSNIPLIGYEKSYALLKEHTSIENVLQHLRTVTKADKKTPKYPEESFDVLKYPRCREIFTTHPVEFYVQYCGIPDMERLQEFLFKHNVHFNFRRLKQSLEPREIEYIENVEDEKKDSDTQ